MSAKMDWCDDPELAQQERERRIRRGILRSAILWTPLFLGCLGLLLFFTFDEATGGDRGSWFLVGVLVFVTTLFGFQSIHALLDLRSKPTQESGWVTRRWHRNDAVVVRSHYVRVNRNTILRGEIDQLDGIRLGDWVEARYYRHSAVLVAIEKTPPPEGEERPELLELEVRQRERDEAAKRKRGGRFR